MIITVENGLSDMSSIPEHNYLFGFSVALCANDLGKDMNPSFLSPANDE